MGAGSSTPSEKTSVEASAASQKYLFPKYLYDATGSLIFEQITELPEYYPTRTELAILCAQGGDILRRAAPLELLELGSGASTKVCTLLDARPNVDTPGRYVAFDVSESIVRAAGDDLLERYRGLELHGVIGDFQRHLGMVPSAIGRRLVLFLGSTLGNLEQPEQCAMLAEVRKLLVPGDSLLLGVDLVKDVSVLEAAYNDSAGVTAAFSRNILSVINNALRMRTLTKRTFATAPTTTRTPPASKYAYMPSVHTPSALQTST